MGVRSIGLTLLMPRAVTPAWLGMITKLTIKELKLAAVSNRGNWRRDNDHLQDKTSRRLPVDARQSWEVP